MTDRAEAVDIARADTAPVDELNAELESPAHRAQELDFVDAQRVIEGAQVRNRGLADPDRADIFGFDELDRDRELERARERRRRHPASGSAANDDDVLQPGVVVHEMDDDTVGVRSELHAE